MKKLAILKQQNECPFGLPILNGCKCIGNNIYDLQYLDAPTTDISDEQINAIKENNNKILNELKTKEKCPFAKTIWEDENIVDCTFLNSSKKIPLPQNRFQNGQWINPFGLYDNFYSTKMPEYIDVPYIRNMYYGIYNWASGNDHSHKNLLDIINNELNKIPPELAYQKVALANILASFLKSNRENSMNKTAQPHIHLEDIVVYPEGAPESAMEASQMHHDDLEVGEEDLKESDFKLNDIPGGSPDDHEDLEVADLKESKEDKEEVEIEIKPTSAWDWSALGLDQFLPWVKGRLSAVPQHSGQSAVGIERAISYLEKLRKEISQAVKEDHDGVIPMDLLEKACVEIENGIERLSNRLDKLTGGKSKKRVKKSDDENSSLVKEGMSPGIKGVYVTVPLLISRVVRSCINGMVSGGHDPSAILADNIKKFALSEREIAECIQLMADMGLPLSLDAERKLMPGDPVDLRSSDNHDFMANYQA